MDEPDAGRIRQLQETLDTYRVIEDFRASLLRRIADLRDGLLHSPAPGVQTPAEDACPAPWRMAR